MAADRRTARSLLRLTRPGQWPKNLLVLAAPLAAGVIDEPDQLVAASAACLAFILAAAAVYAVNDVLDADDDRRHPTKRHRPVAAGELREGTALLLAAGCGAASVGVSAALGWLMALVVVAYLASSAAYVLGVKRVPVLDVVAVAVGFVLRALGGAAATHLPVSSWFLLVSLFGSLFLVCAKRRAEIRAVPPDTSTRPALAGYSSEWFTQVITLSLTGAVLAYASWSVQLRTDAVMPVLAASVLPLLVGLLRYLLMVDQCEGERPEDLARDPLILGCVGVWLTLVTGGLYLA
ncbi:decaprenyl-phosphate phosphoribosyltransferase [Angustibacter sp. McL0619]|uniref:decaprenyl-phosphate phosphoribosyltransferase n=1 Tax=Angustibacter sp. McL0619 TaxID=3415676 RepID=UPI003CEDB33E